MSDQHIYPVNDLREHDLESNDCWCSPLLTSEGAIIHNSLDERELYEQGKRELN